MSEISTIRIINRMVKVIEADSDGHKTGVSQ